MEDAAPGRTPTVVVGVDGSPTARTALLWAAEHAARTGARLQVVHAWSIPAVASPWAYASVPSVDLDPLERSAQAVVREAADVVREELGAAAPLVDAAVAHGSPVSVLVDASSDADLLVVGTRGHGRIVSAIVGSTAAGCAHRSEVPVAVVGESAPAVGGSAVLVGFDGSTGSAGAVRWAARCARDAGARLRVVHSWSPDLASPFGGPADGSAVFDLTDPAPLVERQVADVLADLDGAPPVEVEVIPAPAASALLDEARDASVLVVGSRGHGDITGILLGSVSNRCLHHSPCPVVVVPAADPAAHRDEQPAAGTGA